MVIPPDGQVLVSAEDCSDYYYLLQHSEARIGETVVGYPVWSADLSVSSLARGDAPPVDGNTRLDVCLRAPAMGDCKSPDLAQATHQHVLLEGELSELNALDADEVSLHESRWLTYGWPTPALTHWQGAYVDDMLLASIVSPRLDHLMQINSEAEHHRILHRVRARYAEVGLIRKEAKAKEAVKECEVWGCTVSSSKQSPEVLPILNLRSPFICL
eukprot:4367642-Amphidinium_carterae.1